MKKLFILLLFLMMTGLMIWCAGLLWFGTNVTTTEQTTAQVPKADAIIVLTGGKGRIDEGFYLFATKRAPKLFITGVNRKVSEADLKYSWEGAPLPECCLDIGYTARNTMGNATETAGWLQNNKDVKSAFLVTSDYHMPRAQLEFSNAAPNLKTYPHPVYFDRKNRSTYEYLRLLVGEYHKTILTYLRHTLF